MPNGYAEITANVANISAIQDVAGLSITVTGNGQPMMVEVWIGGYQNSVANNGATVYLTDELNNILARGDALVGVAASNYGPMVVKYKVAAFTGNKTFKVRAQNLVGGLATIVSGAARKSFIEACYR